MTLYLKYRPQNLDELDLTYVRESLKKILESDNIPHAFLFAGPKGTGKTSTARILAKIINCEKGKITPCDECEECLSITKGVNLDVIELDAASHRGIDDIRVLRDAVKLAPTKAKKKVYIIDEAHMLTTEASNALLKTLEEPPSHVVFILATTNPEKLIGTIHSRTTIINFTKATIEETIRSLERVAKGEKVKIDNDALKIIAKASGGAFRDAVKILENLISEKIVLDENGVSEFLFNRKGFELNTFVQLLSKKETKKLVEIVADFVSKGVSVENVTEDLIKHFRLILLSKIGIGDVAQNDFSKADLLTLINLFSEAKSNMSDAIIEELPLEIAIIKWCEELGGVDETGGKEKPKIDRQTDEKKVDLPSASEKQSVVEKKDEMTKNADKNEVARDAIDLGNIKEINDEVWKNILAKMRPINASIEALLRSSKPIGYDGKNLKVGVYYKFHKERLEDAHHRIVVEDVVTSVFGNPTRVICTLTDPPVREVAQEAKVETVLTESKDQDIIKVAQDIFGS